MKIATLVFGGGVSTLGMSVVKDALVQCGLNKTVQVVECTPADVVDLKTADVILTSLYWWENVLDYIKVLSDLGINPKFKKPILVIGGSRAVNTRILTGFFHYAVLGDGEIIVEDLIRALLDGSDPSLISGVVKDGCQDSPALLRTNPIIPATAYVERRGSRTARIEIARGCRFKCAFCQISHIKPYREQPVEIVEHLVMRSSTKSVGLFAPDRTGYSDFARLESFCRRVGKHNTAEDSRLDMLMKHTVTTKVKFGIEGFSARSRRRFRKLPNDEQILRGFNHIFNVLRTPKGKRISTATVYFIGDLPGETKKDWFSFWDLMQEVDKLCKKKFTLFFTINSFAPMAFTPMEREGINPFNDWNEYYFNNPRLKNIVVARRGGMQGAAKRIVYQMTTRGGEDMSKLLFYFSTSGRKVLRDSSRAAGKHVVNLIQKSGGSVDFLCGQLSKSDKLPHDNITIEPV